MIEFDYIDNTPVLNDWLDQLPTKGVVAFDTEFARESTYHPEPALIQLRCEDRTGIIDPTSIDDFTSLVRLLENPAVVKVMHSCDEDLEVFLRLCNVVPSPLFDTQIAAAIVGMDFSMSYGRLVKHFTGVELDKSETRSNWLQRPLTDSQLHYAAADVEWLLPVYHELSEKLEALHRLDWCEQESNIRITKASKPVVPAEAYLRIKSAWRLSPEDLVRLHKLCEWREREALNLNVPRGRVISDSALLELLTARPKSVSQLAKIQGVGPYTRRNYGEQLFELVATSINKSEFLEPLPDKRSPTYRGQIRAMQNVARELSGELNIPVELLGRKRDLEEYLLERQSSLIANSWRSSLLSDRLEKILANG